MIYNVLMKTSISGIYESAYQRFLPTIDVLEAEKRGKSKDLIEFDKIPNVVARRFSSEVFSGQCLLENVPDIGSEPLSGLWRSSILDSSAEQRLVPVI